MTDRVRLATVSDAVQIVDAAIAYCKATGQPCEVESVHDSVFKVLTEPQYRVFVLPGRAHCILAISASMYDNSHTIARIVSTWGDGGLRVLRHALDWCKAHEVHEVIADTHLEPRIAKWYARQGFAPVGQLFQRTL